MPFLGLALGGEPVVGLSSVRGCSKYPGRQTLKVPQTPPRACVIMRWGLLVPGTVPHAALGRWGSSGWVRPTLSEKVAFSSYLRKKRWSGDLEGVLSRTGPPSARLRPLCARSVFLSSTAARASPLRVRGGSRGARALSSLPVFGTVLGVLVSVAAGREAAHDARLCGALCLPGRRRGMGSGKAAVGSRSHPSPRLSPVPLCRVRTSGWRPRLGRSRDAGVAVRACVPCVLGLCGCRLAPPSSAAFPRLVGSRESLLPSAGGSGGFRAWWVWPRSRGGLFRENGVWLRPARRRTWGPAAARGPSTLGVGACICLLSRWCLLGLLGVRRFSCRLGAAGCGGTAQGSVQWDSRRMTSCAAVRRPRAGLWLSGEVPPGG